MPVFYVDIDRTMFRTERANELFAAIEQLYPDNQAIKGGYEKRHKYYEFKNKDHGDDVTYYHDFVLQLQEAGISPSEVFEYLRQELGDGRFEYPGAHEFIERLRAMGTVKALTYGEDAYQRLKAALCPSLAGVEVIAVLGDKADYLNRYASAGDWIIDDKEITGLNPGIRAVHIRHDGQGGDVHSLAQAMEYISKRT